MPSNRNAASSLTSNEGAILSAILRLQPVTAYGATKYLRELTGDSFNTSKGKVYPLIRRLIGRTLIDEEPSSADRKSRSRLRCTARGREAVLDWLRRGAADGVALHDPLLIKAASLEILSREEQLSWVRDARLRLLDHISFIVGEREPLSPYRGTLAANLKFVTEARLAWLHRLQIDIEAGL